MRWIAVAAALASLAACSKKKNADGLPPANQWSADQAGAEMPAAAAPGDPHAGMDMSNPHPGPVDPDGPNPHAGMDMSNPHAAGGGGTDVSQLGLPAPDPDRKIDPSHHVRGVIAVGGKAKVPAGSVVFLAAKRPGADGKPVDPPLAVERLTYQGGDLAFELGEAQAMVAGTELIGDVIITAHYAQNGDALSRAAGDVIGSARVKVPAEGVKITLDTVLP
jgi:predicted small lipoprotein YifL